MILDDGSQITTYVEDNGERMYMDWDHQCWLPLTEAIVRGEPEETPQDDRLFEHEHPTAGQMFVYLVRPDRH